MSPGRQRGAAGSVRIIGGRWRGTRLQVPEAPGLRPTSDRVRETLFNWLQPMLPGARVLDLFAGSGALGLEAVSRGAAHAQLVEVDAALAQALQAAVQRLSAGDAVMVDRADALAWLRRVQSARFDIVFVDPPFQSALWPDVLRLLPGHLADAAWLYLEMPLNGAPIEQLPGFAAEWALHRESSTREVRYALYRRATLAPIHSSDTLATT